MSDTNHQAEALRIADALIPGQVSVILRHAAADELRRQHAEIADLKEDFADCKWRSGDLQLQASDLRHECYTLQAEVARLTAERVPLTDQRKFTMWGEALERPKIGPMTSDCWYLAGIQDAERAHGIESKS